MIAASPILNAAMIPTHSHLFAASLLLLPTASPYVHALTRADYMNRAIGASNVLIYKWYSVDTGLFQDLWWQTANSITALADLALLDGELYSMVSPKLENTLSNAGESQPGSFLNDYFDDEGWWALAWIKAYDASNDPKFLNAAITIFQDMMTGQNSACGGIWWSKAHAYTATIANELFFATAAALANRAGNTQTDYHSIAANSLDWIQSSGLLSADNIFADGRDPTQNCAINPAVYTYNQGVILGGLVEFYKLTGNSSQLDYANTIAHGAIMHMTDSNGILTEPGPYPSPLDNQGAQFKGVFVRNLGYLHLVSPSNDYAAFLTRNADSLWTTSQMFDGEIGPDWQGPLYTPDAPSQTSGIDCLIAAANAS